MAQFRTSADIVDAALRNAGEVTNGNSAYEAEALAFVNRVHFSLIAGGTIALGKDVTVEIDETFPWARSKRPMVLELQPKYDSGSLALTLGSEAGTFSSAPSYSVAGWYLKPSGSEGVYRIASHTASASAFELDAAFPESSITSGKFEVFKLDYDLTPDYIVIDSSNNKLDFKKTSAGSLLTATLTAGAYTPAQLATHAATQITSAAAGPTVTGAYSAITKKFTLTSDGAGTTTLLPFFATGTNVAQSAHTTLGFDTDDLSASVTQTSTYILGGVARLIEPMTIHRGLSKGVFGIDKESFSRDYPFAQVKEKEPDRFCVFSEGADGSFRVRFNAFPAEKVRIEVEFVEVPKDLKDNAGSIPLVPRKHVDVLEDAATARIMFLKNDDRATLYMQLTQGTLLSMVNQHRGSLLRSAQNFAQIIPRRDLIGDRRRRLFPEEPY